MYPIGKTYDGGQHRADPEHALAYAMATHDTSGAYMGPHAICPPMFHVRLMHPLIFQIATDPELRLDLLRLVHGEHDATFLAPIRPGEIVRTEAELLSCDEKPSGLTVTSALRGFVGDELRVLCRTVYFIRAEKRPEATSAPKAATPEPDPQWRLSLRVSPDQSWEYAKASLDDNPIHVDPATAQRAGLPDVIVQGLCTMAMTGAAIIRSRASNDAARLGRLAVRFSRPVLNGDDLTVNLRAEGDDLLFTTTNARGQAVLSHGRCALR